MSGAPCTRTRIGPGQRKPRGCCVQLRVRLAQGDNAANSPEQMTNVDRRTPCLRCGIENDRRVIPTRINEFCACHGKSHGKVLRGVELVPIAGIGELPDLISNIIHDRVLLRAEHITPGW